MQPTVAVIGAGAMGEAILRGLVAAGWPLDAVTATDTDRPKLDAIGVELGIVTTDDAAGAIVGRDVVVVVVKPNHVTDVLTTIAPSLSPSQVVLSVAAGVPTSTYESRLPGVPVVRAMPNTPALLGAGAAAIAPGSHAERRHLDMATAILGAVGVVTEVPEEMIDAVTAVSGSGPAYVFLLSEAMQEAGRELGLPSDVAEKLVNQTIFGAGRMLTETDTDAATLRQRVTSPNGTTAAALDALADGGFTGLVTRAVAAAERRSRELGRES